MSRRQKIASAIGLVVVSPVIALVLFAAALPLPSELLEAPAPSVRVLDRNGGFLREVRREGGELSGPVRLSDVTPEVVAALLAAEDARFFSHPGVDPLATVRALFQCLVERRIVSGGSTITQQLARTLVNRPRTLSGKFREMALALRIEWSLSKERILEEYLSRVAFGPNVRGIDAASRAYFDKPPKNLSLAEAAALVSVPRGPSVYDPRRAAGRLLARRNRVLDRMVSRELWDEGAIGRARSEPLNVRRTPPSASAWHFVRALAAGRFEPWSAGPPREIVSTLDPSLQAEVEVLVASAAERVVGVGATAVSALVVDNASSEVLAYVGSPDFFSEEAEGQNDGVRALRQVGSTLKPFVYAAAMQELGLSAASILPDVELHIPSSHGTYSPKNYDGRFHGPVRLRVALGSSLNVPAVHTASRVGVGKVLALLREIGFVSLDRDAAHYGAALALGGGEVRLSELAAAYATLARGGMYAPLRTVREARAASGERIDRGARAPVRVVDSRVASILTDILSDTGARAAAFGLDSALETPFPAAVKTGTSKGFRDNLAVGYTRDVTVAVWVGNFDGTPMVNSSGVTSAAPLFRDIAVAAMQHRASSPLFAASGLIDADVCPLSGLRPSAACPHGIRERFASGTEPHEACSMHALVAVDDAGRRARPECPGVTTRVVESYGEPFTEWALLAGRPIAPSGESVTCPPEPPRGGEGVAPAVVYPPDGATFLLDPGISSDQQQIVLRARVGTHGGRARFVVDGRELGDVPAPYSFAWPLTRGAHTVRVVAGDRASHEVAFEVR